MNISDLSSTVLSCIQCRAVTSAAVKAPAVHRDQAHCRSTDKILSVKAFSPTQWSHVAILVDDVAVDSSAKGGARVHVGAPTNQQLRKRIAIRFR